MAKLISMHAPFIEEYITYKRNMGYKFGYDSTFAQFDHFLYDNGYTDIPLTKEICRKWEEKGLNESDMNRYQRVGLIHNYALFLAKKGYETAAPEHDYKPRSTFIPYIFTQEELDRFFCACDSFGGYASAAYPALFRTIYGCGMRKTEALDIRIQDMDLDRKTIYVRMSKNRTERMLPVSDSVFQAIEAYYRLFRPDAAKDDFLFVTRFGTRISDNALYARFRQCLERAGIAYGGRGKGPRIHDLRHSFSVHTMAKMAEQGTDLYCFLPILSKYLGHKSIKATEGYVRLTAEVYPDLLNDMNEICGHIYPEVTLQ